MSWTEHPTDRRDTLPPDWGTIRAQVLAEDNARGGCRIAGPHCAGPASEVDHIGDRHNHTRGNLRGACPTCHGERTGQQGGQAAGRERRRQAALRKRPTEPHPGLTHT